MSPDSARASPDQDEPKALRRREPPFSAKVSFAGHVYGLQGILRPLFWVQDWKEYFFPPPGGPNIIKTYECRPYLPVRIFFPQSYDQTSSRTLPTLFTIHGGGFCIGHIRDDDAWNRAFADTQNTLVVALNYSKAPGYPFPHAIHDIEALLLAALADESLPIDRRRSPRSRTALLGFSAGGTLALAASQLPAVRAHPLAPAAAVPVYAYLDMATPPDKKLINRPYKANLALPRGAGTDGLMALLPTFDWSYIPYGTDLRDPLLSPYYAERAALPPFVAVVAAELDMLAHESWRFACRLAGEGTRRRGVDARVRFEVRDARSKDTASRICGRRGVTGKPGVVRVLDKRGEVDERFAFEERWEGGGVKWLLVPDVLHAFDNKNIREIMGGEETVVDAEEKTKAVIEELGAWLRGTVWEVEG